MATAEPEWASAVGRVMRSTKGHLVSIRQAVMQIMGSVDAEFGCHMRDSAEDRKPTLILGLVCGPNVQQGPNARLGGPYLAHKKELSGCYPVNSLLV